MSGTSTTKFTASGTVPNQEALGRYHRFKFDNTNPHVKLQAYSQYVPTSNNTSTINIETRNSNYSGFRWHHTTQSTDTNSFGSFSFQSFVADGAGVDVIGFDGSKINMYFPVYLSGLLDMGSNKINNLANPSTTTDAINLGYAETLITNSGIALTGDVTGTGTIGGGVATTLVLKLNQIPVATGAVNINSQNMISLGNVGIGVSSPAVPLQFANVVADCKIALYRSANNFQVYGLGVLGNILKYSVDSSASSHVFYCGASSTTSTELFKIAGTGYATVSGGDGTFYSRVPSANWFKTGNALTTAVSANTWTKANVSTGLIATPVQFTVAANKLTFTGSDLSASCTGMFSASAVLTHISGTPKLGIAVYLNGLAQQGCAAYVSPTAAGNLYNLSITPTQVTLSPTDYLEIWVLASTATTITVTEMTLAFSAC